MQEAEGGGLSVGEQRELLARILRSELFSKSHRLSAFLKFICEQYMAGNAASINEQRIGTEVFGRPPGYHVGEDSIVRSQARFLRQRLEEYFSSEGRDEPWVLLIPKGSYVPLFERREVPAPVLPGSAARLAVATHPRQTEHLLRKGWVAASITAAIVLIAVLVWWRERVVMAPTQTAESRVVSAFWSSLFNNERTTLIVPADSTLVLLEEMSGKPIHLLSYINKEYLKTPPPSAPALWQIVTSSQYTNMADLNLVAHLERVPEAAKGRSEIRYARELSLKELKEANAILIGGPRSNPWLELFSSMITYDVDHDFSIGHNVVRNLSPGSGEKSLYVESTTDSAQTSRAYGVVVYAPGLDNVGHVLLVEGTSKPGTEAAAEFLTSAEFGQFLQDIGGTAKEVPEFEVLLGTGSMNGASYSPSIISWHRLNKPASH